MNDDKKTEKRVRFNSTIEKGRSTSKTNPQKNTNLQTPNNHKRPDHVVQPQEPSDITQQTLTFTNTAMRHAEIARRSTAEAKRKAEAEAKAIAEAEANKQGSEKDWLSDILNITQELTKTLFAEQEKENRQENQNHDNQKGI